MKQKKILKHHLVYNSKMTSKYQGWFLWYCSYKRFFWDGLFLEWGGGGAGRDDGGKYKSQQFGASKLPRRITAVPTGNRDCSQHTSYFPTRL